MGLKNSNCVYLYNLFHDHRWNYGQMSQKKHYTEDASFFLTCPSEIINDVPPGMYLYLLVCYGSL